MSWPILLPRRRLTLLLATLTTLLLAGCSQPTPDRLKRGDELYAYYCRSCHEQQGMGAYLEKLPLTPASLKLHEVVLMIKHGYPQGHRRMPVFPQLSDTQAEAVARFILQQRYNPPRQAQ